MEFIYETDFRSGGVRMYLKTEKNGRICLIGQKDGLLIEQTRDPINVTVEPLVPLLEMSGYFAKDFVKAVCDYASNKGVKTENENLLAGKLLATEKHLEDLRIHFTKVLDKVVAA